jgi:hypothetical protein
MVFGKHPGNVSLYVNNERVSVVEEFKYLGHIISNKKNDPMIKCVKNDFVTKVNTFLGNFTGVSSDVKSDLFKQYCTSFYGSQSCMLYHKSFNELNIAWRKAMRRIWNVPYRTHGALLPFISGQNPCDVSLYKRFIRHFISGINHKNASVSTIFHSSLYTGGRLYKNLRHVTNYCKLKLDVVDLSVTAAENIIQKVWNENVNESNIRCGYQIKELCMQRDYFEKWCLTVNETDDIIKYLCTA